MIAGRVLVYDISQPATSIKVLTRDISQPATSGKMISYEISRLQPLAGFYYVNFLACNFRQSFIM
jgi:hypothetical protein